MPGRIARASAPARHSSPPAQQYPPELPSTGLRTSVAAIFADAQRSTAAHRKAIIALRRLQETCAYEPATSAASKRGSNKRAVEEFGEEDFNAEVLRCVMRILPVRKAEAVGDRTLRFLGTFLHVASGKDAEIASAGASDEAEDEGAVIETPSTRLSTLILGTLLPLLSAKDKTIRFRATQVTSHIVNSLDTLDDALFHQLRLALLKRIHDKEAPVRLQAVYGLGRLAAEVEEDEDATHHSDSDSDSGVGQGVLVKLLAVLQHDPSAEVRRNLLLNLPLTKEVLPYLLERARDADATTRRALYARLLPALGDFRHLSLTHREKLLRWGLRDRDESVRKATSRLFAERWIEDCAALPAGEEPEVEAGKKTAAAAPSLDALLELLERIDVVNSGSGAAGIALQAMREFWALRPGYVEYVSFPEEFWEDLSPELAFVARTFNDYCRSPAACTGGADLGAMIEEKLPEVTRFGFLLEKELGRLVTSLQQVQTSEEEEGEGEEEIVQREFVVEQMLHMALTFDYSDEVGRRQMFGFMREAVSQPEVPEECTRLCVEVLRTVCTGGEGEFCAVIMEAVAEVHDTIMGEDATIGGDTSGEGDESFHSATEVIDEDAVVMKKGPKKSREEEEQDAEREQQRALREIVVNMKCLHIALCMLQNVSCDLGSNPHLVTCLNNLVVPAVRSQEAPLRERGLCCLGLSCLLSPNLARENLSLFLHCFAKGHASLQTICLQIVADILLTHPSILLPSPSTMKEELEGEQDGRDVLQNQILKTFGKALKSPDAGVQATAATALAKLMLAQLLTDADLLRQLVVLFFDSDTADNHTLRQGLSYFLPVYCHVLPANARRMVGVACAVVSKVAAMEEEEDEEAEAEGTATTQVKLASVGGMLVEWTDPRQAVPSSASSAAPAQTHFYLAESILERLVTSQLAREERKVLLSMLGKLHLGAAASADGSGVDGELVKSVLELLAEAQEAKVAVDASGRNVLAKLQTAMLRLVREVAEAERGGDETVLQVEDERVVESTEVAVDDTEMDVEEEVTRLGAELRDTTIGAPDAESTRVGLGIGEDETGMESEDDNTVV